MLFYSILYSFFIFFFLLLFLCPSPSFFFFCLFKLSFETIVDSCAVVRIMEKSHVPFPISPNGDSLQSQSTLARMLTLTWILVQITGRFYHHRNFQIALLRPYPLSPQSLETSNMFSISVILSKRNHTVRMCLALASFFWHNSLEIQPGSSMSHSLLSFSCQVVLYCVAGAVCLIIHLLKAGWVVYNFWLLQIKL